MKKGLIVCLAAAGALMVGCNKNITSLYGQTLSYKGVVNDLNEKVETENTETTIKQYFIEHFSEIDMDDAKSKYSAFFEGVDTSTADSTLNGLAKNIEKSAKEKYQTYKFVIGSKEQGTAKITNAEGEKDYTVKYATEPGSDLALEFNQVGSNAYYTIIVQKLDNKQFTLIRESDGITSYTLGQAMQFDLKGTTNYIPIKYYVTLL